MQIVELKGKISDPPAEGRAVARLTDLGHGQSLRALFAEGAGDGPVPDGLARAVVEVLGDWRPQVDGIVVVESATRPTLTRDLADGLSRYLRVPVLGQWALVDPDVAPGQGAMNSAQRVAAVGRRFALQADDLDGRIRWRSRLFEQMVHVDDITWPGVRTLYARFGDAFAWACVVVSLGALAAGVARRRRPPSESSLHGGRRER